MGLGAELFSFPLAFISPMSWVLFGRKHLVYANDMFMILFGRGDLVYTNDMFMIISRFIEIGPSLTGFSMPFFVDYFGQLNRLHFFLFENVSLIIFRSLQCSVLSPIYGLQRVEVQSTGKLLSRVFFFFSFDISILSLARFKQIMGTEINRLSVFKIGIILFFSVLVWYQLTTSVLLDSHSSLHLFPFVIMGKGWVRTPEQEEYLESEFQNYLKARIDGDVKNWRTMLHSKWEERWPERQVLINEWNLSDDTPLNTTQMATLGEALAARKTVNALIYHNTTFIQFFF